ncbi:diguanylate cyclase [Kushneria phosphatilytica]|uniref:diguanylate cyclase n=1 Tax=Kushneria phosphatilytica TaxID=657387 RepID=A0A1S1NYZ7_9GAMM|nr:diguanylate cyclase [Kushneria phosphatilytica]OHV12093.1 hypothetical protein BH688_05400 [Kushneria phosphatilytica]QEL11288.1 diguanylate cyclase [Kushneria phosphatilytica]
MHSLRTRFLISIGLVTCLALLVLILIARWLVYPNLIERENEYAEQELTRVRSAIQSDLDNLGGITRDWANWDASYDFVLGRRPDYAAENFSQDMFEDTRQLMMVYLDLQGKPIWVAGYDPVTASYSSCRTPTGECAWTAKVVRVIRAHVRQQHTDLAQWLLSTPSPMMAATSSILPTDPDAAPTVGWLTIVSRLNDDWLKSIRQQTGVNIALDAVVQPSFVQLPQLIRLDRDRLMINHPLPADPAGTMLDLQAVLPRRDFAANWRTFHFATSWTAVLLIMVITVVLALLERMVIIPTRKLARFTRERRQQPSPESRLPASLLARRDEIGSLAREFQCLLLHQQAQTESLEQLSRRDHLTGLYNCRYLDQYLASEQPSSGPNRTPLGLIVIDIDFFKAYNDYYGHPEGDRCLRQVAHAMEACLAEGEIIARSGGEEFTVVMPNSSENSVMARAEQLRLAVARLELRHERSAIAGTVTISLGFAVQDPESPCLPGELVREADKTLYQAKLAGRNRVHYRDEFRILDTHS